LLVTKDGDEGFLKVSPQYVSSWEKYKLEPLYAKKHVSHVLLLPDNPNLLPSARYVYLFHFHFISFYLFIY